MLCKYDADSEKLRFMLNTKGQTANQMVNNEEIAFAFGSNSSGAIRLNNHYF